MTSTFRLGRIAGVELGAHWSWLLVVALIIWSLAAGVFPATNPGLSDGTYSAMAVVAAVLFFASLLLHELGHAVRARRDGIEVEGITLWVFGGVARLRAQPPSAGAELRMAAAGPAVSLVIGVVFLVAAIALPLPAEVDAVVFWVGQINLYLLAFNMLPALPLDGGRVLRAILWARRRDFGSATRTAGRLGQFFGQLLIAVGLFLLIFVGDFGGAWLAFIGWFLLGAAEAELETAEARDALAGLTAADAMVRDPVTVDADASVQSFMDEVFVPTRHTAFPVVSDGRVVGIVSFRLALTLPAAAWPSVRVREIMVPAAEASVDPETPLSEALMRLVMGEVRRLLVYRDGQLMGLLSLTDAARLAEVRKQALSRKPASSPAAWRLRSAPARPVAHARASPVSGAVTGLPVRTIELPSGEAIPVLGLGTWGFGEDPGRRAAEIATLRDGVAVGLTLIDTAELYGGGRSEEVVGEAIDGRRDDVFLVSKVLPSNATRTGTIAACERSLRRLGTERLDLYLLHWRGKVPLRETLDAFADLREKGWIRYWGVCNFDVTQMTELRLFGGEDVTTDQVLYNLQHRAIEHDLLPWCLERGIPLMTYLPLEGGRILDHPALRAVADRHGATPAQVALAWILRHERLATIATATRPEHVRENLSALTLPLDLRDVAALDEAFPRPAGPRALEIH